MEKTTFFDHYQQIFSENSLLDYISEPIMETMYRMVEHLLHTNASMNLTAITDWDEILVKHLADSCTILPYIPEGAKVCDVGCGGGFPSIPIAIARPDITVVGIDSTGKKVDYINGVSRLFGLGNLSAVCGRAEDLAKTEMREAFDVVTARAVATLPVLCELCIPFVRVGGIFCAMKGRSGEEELKEATNAYRLLGAPICPDDVHVFTLNGESRVIFATKKQQETPAIYPRAYAQIKKKPL